MLRSFIIDKLALVDEFLGAEIIDDQKLKVYVSELTTRLDKSIEYYRTLTAFPIEIEENDAEPTTAPNEVPNTVSEIQNLILAYKESDDELSDFENLFPASFKNHIAFQLALGVEQAIRFNQLVLEIHALLPNAHLDDQDKLKADIDKATVRVIESTQQQKEMEAALQQKTVEQNLKSILKSE